MNDKTSEFITKAKEIHGDKYDYSKVEYINCDTKVLYYTETNFENFSENINNKEILLEKILGN